MTSTYILLPLMSTRPNTVSMSVKLKLSLVPSFEDTVKRLLVDLDIVLAKHRENLPGLRRRIGGVLQQYVQGRLEGEQKQRLARFTSSELGKGPFVAQVVTHSYGTTWNYIIHIVRKDPF